MPSIAGTTKTHRPQHYNSGSDKRQEMPQRGKVHEKYQYAGDGEQSSGEETTGVNRPIG
jgi:hypothetical protein